MAARGSSEIWLEVGQEEQERRFRARVEDPIRQWKLSPMDIQSYDRWYDYSRARDMLFEYADTDVSPWYVVHCDDKKRARLNVIAHIPSQIRYKKADHPKVKEVRQSGVDRRSAVGGATVLS
jgi:polyphosphate kinase 2 (PPK2 family)